ncbi:MAG: DNA-binding protein HU-beta [Oleiphilaceae bacterium]|jgi:DNA-binding protein HU-beta
MKKTTWKIPAAQLVTKTKVSFIEEIEDLCQSKEQASDVVTAIIESVEETLLEGGSLLFPNSGTISVVRKEPRGGCRNIKTGVECILPARNVVKFGKYKGSANDDGRKPRHYLYAKTADKMLSTDCSVITESIDRFIRFVGSVKNGDCRIEFRRFGVFYPATRPAYQGRNPKTGESISIAQSTTIRFKTSSTLNSKLN